MFVDFVGGGEVDERWFKRELFKHRKADESA
jgi:hypothetical protein